MPSAAERGGSGGGEVEYVSLAALARSQGSLPQAQQPALGGLEFAEPARQEVEAWRKSAGFVPRGVLSRLAQEEEAERMRAEMLRRAHEDELNKRGPSLEWMPDEACRICYACEKPFSFANRRHHCRICGLVFCGACSNNWVPGVGYGYGALPIRACNECAAIATKPVVKTATAIEDDYGPLGIEPQHESSDELEAAQQLPLATPRKSRLVSSTSKMQESAQSIFLQRERSLISSLYNFLMEKMGMADWAKPWKDSLTRFANGVCDVVVPDPLGRDDLLDVCEYVRVCLIPSPGGDSRLVNGAVLRHNLVHRLMPRSFSNPRIMLLATGIELERGELRVSSLERIAEQEELYLQLVCRKVCSVNVQVLLVGGTVARVAQDLLLEKGVAVASLVPLPDLEWLSRLTGALVLPSTEYITRSTDPTGTCTSFYVDTLPTLAASRPGEPPRPASRSSEKETFLFFEGTPPRMGATVCLRGETFGRLDALGSLLVQLTRRLWSLKQQHAFFACMDDDGVSMSSNSSTVYGTFRPVRPAVQMTGSESADMIVLLSEGIEFGRVGLKGYLQAYTPEMVTRLFFGAKDRSLGEFLLRHCFNPPMSSNDAAGDFALVFIHGDGRLRLSSERLSRSEQADMQALVNSTFSKSNSNNSLAGSHPVAGVASSSAGAASSLASSLVVDGPLPILTWGVCNKCPDPVQTAVKVLSPGALGMSMAMWVQTMMYAQGLPGPCCAHSLLHDHTRCFFRDRHLVSVEYDCSPPLRFQHPNRLALSNKWRVATAREIVGDFMNVLPETKRLFLDAVHNVEGFEELQVHIEETCQELALQATSSGQYDSPIRALGLFRALFVKAVDWNALIKSGAAHDTHVLDAILRLSSRPAVRLSDLGQTRQKMRRRPSVVEITEGLQRLRRASGSDGVKPFSPTEATSEGRDSSSCADDAGGRGADSTVVVVAAAAAPAAPATTPRKPKTSAQPVVLPTRLVLGHLLLPASEGASGTVVAVHESEPTSWIAHALNSASYRSKMTRVGHDYASVLRNSRGEAAEEIRLSFSDASEYSPVQCAFSVKILFPVEFHALRMLCLADAENPEDYFLDCMSRCTAWKPTGGKTNANFLKTQDDRLIVKSMSYEELDMFKEFAAKYFSYMADVYGDHAKSVLVPFLGMFSVTMQSEGVSSSRPSLPVGANVHNKLLVVTPNIFWNQRLDAKYDLKGNTRNRFVRDQTASAVRLDVNFFQDHKGVPVSLYPDSKQRLARAVAADCAFLAGVGVVDYSLLIGLSRSGGSSSGSGGSGSTLDQGDKSERSGVQEPPPADVEPALVCGIIDYLQLYTARKMIESTVKKAGMVTGFAEPTVISPSKYGARFAQSLDRFFISCSFALLRPVGLHESYSSAESGFGVGPQDNQNGNQDGDDGEGDEDDYDAANVSVLDIR